MMPWKSAIIVYRYDDHIPGTPLSGRNSSSELTSLPKLPGNPGNWRQDSWRFTHSRYSNPSFPQPVPAPPTSSNAPMAPIVSRPFGSVTEKTTVSTPVTSWTVCVTPPPCGSVPTASVSPPNGDVTGPTTVVMLLMSRTAVSVLRYLILIMVVILGALLLSDLNFI